MSCTKKTPTPTTNNTSTPAGKWCYTCYQLDIYNNYVKIQSTKDSFCDSAKYSDYMKKSAYPLVYNCTHQ